MPDLTRREMGQVVGIGLVIVAVSFIPYLLGYFFAPPDMQFGGLLVDLDDSYSYLAKMQLGADGGWEYKIPFTPEEHSGAYVYTFHLALGKLSSLLGFSLIQTYQLTRMACGLSLLVMAYVFLAHFVQSREARLVAYLLIAFSSGLGWLVLLGGSTTLRGLAPVDFWLIHGYTFFTVLAFPHSAAAVALLLLFLTLALRHLETFQLRGVILGGVTVVMLGIIHPFAILLVDGILATYWILLSLKRKRPAWREAVAIAVWGLAPLPLAVYYLSAFDSVPVFRSWSAQNVLPCPPIGHLLLGYGILALLAVGGLYHTIQQRNERRLLLLAWVISAVVLLYLPFALQRRMVEGLHVPICILATVGTFEYVMPLALNADWTRRFAHWRGYEWTRLRRLLLYSIVIMTYPSNLVLVAGTSLSTLHTHPGLYYYLDEIAAVDWLRENTEDTDTVLSSYELGRLIPARAGNRVFMGHAFETVDVHKKTELAARFFQESTSDDFRRDLLTEYGIRYVFYGPQERVMGEFDPSEAAYLLPAYTHASVTIYRINAQERGSSFVDGDADRNGQAWLGGQYRLISVDAFKDLSVWSIEHPKEQ